MVTQLCFRHRSALAALVGTLVGALAVARPPAPGAGELAAAALLLVGGSALRLAAMRVMGKSARVHHAGARTLRATGPYARVRNPLYLANAAIAVGLSLLGAGPAGGLTALVGLGVLYALAVRHEERCLLADLGDEYRDYAARVPRWLPRLGAVPAEPVDAVDWAEVGRREFRLVLGVPLALVVVLLVRLDAVPLLGVADRLAAALRLPTTALVVLAGLAAAVGNAASTERKLRRRLAIQAQVAAASPEPPLASPTPAPSGDIEASGTPRSVIPA